MKQKVSPGLAAVIAAVVIVAIAGMYYLRSARPSGAAANAAPPDVGQAIQQAVSAEGGHSAPESKLPMPAPGGGMSLPGGR